MPEACPCIHNTINENTASEASKHTKHAHITNRVDDPPTSDTEVAEEDQDISMDLDSSSSSPSGSETLKSATAAGTAVKADNTKNDYPIRAKEDQAKLKRKAAVTLAEAFPDAPKAKTVKAEAKSGVEIGQVNGGYDKVNW